MKNYSILLLLNFIIFSCTNNETTEDLYVYHYSEKSKLSISSSEDSYMKYGVVEKGENTVFTYRFDAEDIEEIADDESGEVIQFEVDAGIKEFSYSDSKLSEIILVFTKVCYCYFPMEDTKNVPPLGTISG